MSAEYANKDPMDLAREAERDLNSYEAKTGHGGSASGKLFLDWCCQIPLKVPSAVDSGVDESVTSKFPGSTVTTGSAASGAGDNREIPVEEGGDIQKGTGKVTKARDFEGEGGPETKSQLYAQEQPGNDDVRENVR